MNVLSLKDWFTKLFREFEFYSLTIYTFNLVFYPNKKKNRINVTLFLYGPPYIYHGIQ